MRQDARRIGRFGWILLLALMARGAAGQERPPAAILAPGRSAALDRISADSLRGHLSFLASDLLEGRATPSRGLDIAAEYIAAQFRRAGLEAVGDDGYFQTANWEMAETDAASFRFEMAGEGGPIVVDATHVGLAQGSNRDVPASGAFKVDYKSYTTLKPEDLAGKAVLVELPDSREAEPGRRAAIMMGIGIFRAWASSAKAALVVVVDRDFGAGTGLDDGSLVDPEAPRAPGPAQDGPPGRVPMITVHDPKVAALFDGMPVGPAPRTISVHRGGPIRRPVKLRNVVGLLRGSDPALRETYVMVTAHYDHIGIRGPAGTDRIFNGANDDGSGTVSVIELASALGSLKERPRRSLAFVAFFGEERGLLGSKYYGRHPIFPVDRTVADVNLEQIGRTDSSEGPRVAAASLTGFGYSDVSTVFVAAGQAEGVTVSRHPRNSDAYFGRSDNQSLADLGVPAHTLCVAFQYPDYHGAGDHWDKVDYANMARIDRMVARALLTIADDPAEPRWDESNPRAAKYLKAWKARPGR